MCRAVSLVQGRPISPSIRKEVAQYLMGADPRCDHEAKFIMDGLTCPKCLLNYRDYLAACPGEWP